MSKEMTFWHLWVPNKSKPLVHISQACISASLAVAWDSHHTYYRCHSEPSVGPVSDILSPWKQHTHFKFIKIAVYPLVELTGAVVIIPSTAQILKLLAQATLLIWLFRCSRIKELNKNVKSKPEDWLLKWRVQQNRQSGLSAQFIIRFADRWYCANPKIKNLLTNRL